MAYRIKISAAFLFLFIILFGGELRAQFSGGVKDSLRVLCVRYDNCSSGVDGVLSISAIMECDSVKMPTYMVGDSIVVFFSDIKADNIRGIQFLYGRALPKKLQKSFPNGIISITLNDGEDFNSSQVFPDGDNLTRKAFVTRMAFSDLVSGASFAQKAAELVDSYGTDDEAFRNYKYFNPNRVTPILAIDSLNHKVFVRSFNDFRPEAIGEMVVYNSEEAQNVIGDRGINGLVIVDIKPQFTLQQALVSPVEKAVILINEMYGVNFESMMRRDVLYVK